MNKLYILVCGGRHFIDFPLLCDILDNVIGDTKEVEIVSGHCQGADMLGEKYAEEHDMPVKLFPADWTKYGRKAGPIRNKQMVDYIKSFDNRIVIAFTNENTIGTRNTIALAKKVKIPVMEIPYEPNKEDSKIQVIFQDIVEKLKTSSIPFGAMYILPNGTILDLSTFENGHADLWAYLDERIPITCYPQYNISNFLRDLGWIKANTKEGYIASDRVPTKKQTEKIAEILKLYSITAKVFL